MAEAKAELTPEEARKILLTADGKGRAAKEAALDFLLHIAVAGGPEPAAAAPRKFPLNPTGTGTIPWSVAERAFLEYSKRYGTSQSLERLADRGGFYVEEMDDLLPGWRNLAYPAPSSGDAELREARELIEDLVRGDDCEIHPAGYCMTHGEKLRGQPCIHARAKAWLSRPQQKEERTGRYHGNYGAVE